MNGLLPNPFTHPFVQFVFGCTNFSVYRSNTHIFYGFTDMRDVMCAIRHNHGISNVQFMSDKFFASKTADGSVILRERDNYATQTREYSFTSMTMYKTCGKTTGILYDRYDVNARETMNMVMEKKSELQEMFVYFFVRLTLTTGNIIDILRLEKNRYYFILRLGSPTNRNALPDDIVQQNCENKILKFAMFHNKKETKGLNAFAPQAKEDVFMITSNIWDDIRCVILAAYTNSMKQWNNNNRYARIFQEFYLKQ